MTEHRDSRLSPRNLFRLLKPILLAVATAVVLAIGISQWQDWQSRLRQRALLHEMESHSISAENPPTPESFYPVRSVPQPPIVTDFEILTASEAVDEISGNESVLAVKIGDEARAYPLNMLTGPIREIINDELGGRSIAATW